jgi:chromosome segregation ATPase
MSTTPRTGPAPTLQHVLEAWNVVQRELEPQVQAVRKEFGGSRWLGGGKKSATLAKLQEVVTQSAARLQNFQEAMDSPSIGQPDVAVTISTSPRPAMRTGTEQVLAKPKLQRAAPPANKDGPSEGAAPRALDIDGLQRELDETVAQKQKLEEQLQLQSLGLDNLKAQLRSSIEGARQETEHRSRLMEQIDMMQQTGTKLNMVMEERFTKQQNTIEWSWRMAKLLETQVAVLQYEMDSSKSAVTTKLQEGMKRMQAAVKAKESERADAELKVKDATIERLKSEMNASDTELQQKMLTESKSVDSLKAKVDTLQKTLAETRKTHESELQQMSKDLENEKKTSKTLLADLKEKASELGKTAQNLQSAQAKFDELTDAAMKEAQAKAALEAQIVQLKVEMESSKQSLEQNDGAKEKEQRKLASDLAKVRDERDRLGAELDNLKQELVSTKRKMEEELKNANTTISKLTSDADESLEQRTETDSEMKRLREESVRLQNTLNADQETGKKQEEIRQTELQVKNSTIDRLRADIANMHDSAADLEKKLRADLTKSDTELAAARKKCEELTRRAESEGNERQMAEETIAKSESLLARVKDDLDKTTQELLQTAQVCEARGVELKSKESAVETLKSEVSGLQGLVVEGVRALNMAKYLETQVAEVQQEVTQANAASITNMQTAMKRVQDAVKAKERARADAESELKSKIETIESLKVEFSKLQGSASAASDVEKKLRTELATLQGELVAAKRRVEELTQRAVSDGLQRKKLESTIAKYESGHASLKAEFDRKTQELATAVGELEAQKLALDKADAERQSSKDEAAKQMEAEREDDTKKCRELESQLQAAASLSADLDSTIKKLREELSAKDKALQLKGETVDVDDQQQSAPLIKKEAGKAQRSAAPAPPNPGLEKGREPAVVQESLEMVKSLKAQALNADSEIQRLHEQETKLEHALQAAQSLAEKSNKILADRDSELERVRASMKKLEATIELLTKERGIKEKDLAAAETKLRETCQLLDSHLTEIGNLREEVERKESKLRGLEDDARNNSSLSADLDSTKQTIAQKDAELAALSKKLEQTGKMSEDAALINKAKQKLSEQLKIKDEEMQLVEGEVRTLKTSIRDIQDQALLRAHQHAKEIAEVKKELQSMHDAKKLSDIEVQSAESISKSNAITLAAKESELRELQLQYERLRAEKAIADKALESSSEECENLKVHLVNLEDAAKKEALRESIPNSRYSSPSSRTLAVEQLRATELLENVLRCKDVIRLLSENMKRDVLHVEPSAQVSDESRKSTVGIMFDGKGTVESVLIGGPAHASRKIRKGDRVFSCFLHAFLRCPPSCLLALGWWTQ